MNALRSLRIFLTSSILFSGLLAWTQTQYPATTTLTPGDTIRVLKKAGTNYVTRDMDALYLLGAGVPSTTNEVHAATDAAPDGFGTAQFPRSVNTQYALSNLVWNVADRTHLKISGSNLPIVAVEGYTGDGDSITNGAIRLVGKSDIVIEGGRFSFSEYGIPLLIDDCTNVTIRGMEIGGVRSFENTNSQTGVIEITGSSRNIRIEDCYIHDFPQHGIVHRGTGGDHDGLVVDNCRFINGGNTNHPSLGVDGAAVVVSGSVSGSKVLNSYFDSVGRAIEVYTYSSLQRPMRNIQIIGNTMTNIEQRGIIMLSDDTNALNVVGLTIALNDITMANTNSVVPGTTQSAISISGGNEGLAITDNRIDNYPRDGGAQDYGISVTASQGQIESPLIARNRIYGYWAARGVQVYGTANTSGGSFYKIFNGRVLDNYVDDANTGYLIGGNNTEVRGNVVRNWSTAGFSFDEGRDIRAGYNASIKQSANALVIQATTTNVTAWNNNWAGYVTSSGVGVTLDQTSPYTWLSAGSVTLTNGGLVTAAGPQILSVTNNTAPNGSLFLDATGILWTRTNSAWVIK